CRRPGPRFADPRRDGLPVRGPVRHEPSARGLRPGEHARRPSHVAARPHPAAPIDMTSHTAGRRVVISGLGFITSIGNDRAAVSSSLRHLRHGIARHDFIPGADLPVKVAGTIREFDTSSEHYAAWTWPAGYTFGRETLRSLAPHGLHALCAMEQAIAESRISDADLRSDATGLFTASAGSPFLQR